VGAAEAFRVRVVREAEDRHLRVGVGDLVRIDSGDVRDHAVGRVDVVNSGQMVPGQQALQLPSEEQVDPHQQDRGHLRNVPPLRLVSNGVNNLETGVDLIRRGEYFAAHEELEDAWRAAAAEERDFYQGLVHFTVAWYQAGRGNRVGCERQLEKAARRLERFRPEHRGVDLDSVLQQVEQARAVVEAGSLALPAPRL
jgi:predicted metal-dependent hydrolase